MNPSTKGAGAPREVHTPGPWIVQDMSDMVPDEPYWIASEHPKYGLCSFAAVRLGCTEAGELGNMEANARLIAAAPELLSSLILMVRTHDEPADSLLGEMKEQKWLEQARAAIAKATGASA